MQKRTFVFRSGRAVFDGGVIVEYPSDDFDVSIADALHSRLVVDINSNVEDLLIFGEEELS